jgi:hypothetical protein
MTWKRIAIACVVAGLLATGCKEDKSATGSDGEKKVDQSSPEATARALAEATNASDIRRMPDLVVPEQRDTMKKMVEIYAPIFDAQQKLDAAWKKKFPDAPPPSEQEDMGMSVGPEEMTYQEVKIDENDPNKATATFLQGEEGKTDTIQLEKVDGQWCARMGEDDMPPKEFFEEDNPMMQMMSTMAEALNKAADRVEAGEYETPEAAKAGIQQTVQETMASAAQERMKEQMPTQPGDAGPGGALPIPPPPQE